MSSAHPDLEDRLGAILDRLRNELDHLVREETEKDGDQRIAESAKRSRVAGALDALTVLRRDLVRLDNHEQTQTRLHWATTGIDAIARAILAVKSITPQTWPAEWREARADVVGTPPEVVTVRLEVAEKQPRLDAVRAHLCAREEESAAEAAQRVMQELRDAIAREGESVRLRRELAVAAVGEKLVGEIGIGAERHADLVVAIGARVPDLLRKIARRMWPSAAARLVDVSEHAVLEGVDGLVDLLAKTRAAEQGEREKRCDVEKRLEEERGRGTALRTQVELAERARDRAIADAAFCRQVIAIRTAQVRALAELVIPRPEPERAS